MKIDDLFEGGMALKKTVWNRTGGQLRKKEVSAISLERRTWIETEPKDNQNASDK